MLPHGQAGRAHTAPNQTDAIGEGLGRVAEVGQLPRQSDGEAPAEEAEAHVQQDEQADNERVTADAPGLHLFHQFYIVVIAEGGRMDHKAAQQKVDHAGQNGNGNDVRQEAVHGADRIFAQKADREIALQQIAEVDEQIEDESPGDQRVEDTGAAAALPQVAEGQPSAGRVRQSTNKLTTAWEFPCAPTNDQVELPETEVAQVEGDDNRGQKEKFFGKGQHSVRVRYGVWC